MSRDDRDHPLISERSPSYARARHEHAHPAPTADPEEIAVLNRLVEAEDHAAAVCLAAVQALGTAQGAAAQAEIVADLGALHESQVDALARGRAGRALCRCARASGHARGRTAGAGAPPRGAARAPRAPDRADARHALLTDSGQ